MENGMEVPQKVKNRTNVRSNDPTPECVYGKEENLNSKRCMHLMFITALFIIEKAWKQPRCPLAGEQIKKVTQIKKIKKTMEYQL